MEKHRRRAEPIPLRADIDFRPTEALQGRIRWVGDWVEGVELHRPMYWAVFDPVHQRMRRGE